MKKYATSIAAAFLGMCVLWGSFTVANAIEREEPVMMPETDDIRVDVERADPYRYDFISPDEQTLIMFDKKTGEYWRKSIGDETSKWELQDTPTVETTKRSY